VLTAVVGEIPADDERETGGGVGKRGRRSVREDTHVL
jgi:hypothetical protein